MKYFLIVFQAVFLIATAVSAKDYALLLGNSKYQHCNALLNPANDVKVISEKLKLGGYQTTTLENGSMKQMSKQLSRFCESAKGADRVVVFYAGHGIEVEGQNYLIPVDAKLDKKGDQKWESLPLKRILNELAEADIKVKIVVLDCCRDDPFAGGRAWRNTRATRAGGMAEIKASQLSRGTMIVFSGKPGETVPDGKKGGNSPFSEAWSKELKRASGKSIMDVFSDMGDFLPASNKHWVKIDSDGESLALLNRTPFFKVGKLPKKIASIEPAVEKAVVQSIPVGFVHHKLHGQKMGLFAGKFEGDEAYFGLAWSDEKLCSGYCFLHEGGTLYYCTGVQPSDDQLQLTFWRNGLKVRFARLTLKKGKGTIQEWKGTTNLGNINFKSSGEPIKRLSQKARYKGVLGIEKATLDLEWVSSVELEGILKLNGKKAYMLRGENSIKGTLFANLYAVNGEHAATVLLKRSTFEGVSWSGMCHFNNGKKVILTVKR